MKSLLDEPENELTRLQLTELLLRLAPAEFAKLVERCQHELEGWAMKKLAPTLARAWAAIDGPAALPGVMSIWRIHIEQNELAKIAFTQWHQTQPQAAQAWLVEHQEEKVYQNALPDFVTCVADSLLKQNEAALLHWAGQLTGRDLRTAALSPLWQPFTNSDAEPHPQELGALFTKLSSLPNTSLSSVAMQALAVAWADHEPNDWLNFLSARGPDAALFRAAVAACGLARNQPDVPTSTQLKLAQAAQRLAPDLHPSVGV